MHKVFCLANESLKINSKAVFFLTVEGGRSWFEFVVDLEFVVVVVVVAKQHRHRGPTSSYL